MKNKIRFVSILAVLVAVLMFNVVPVAEAMAASDTPCTDRWAGCVAGGGGAEFCDGLWCGCMYATYGYICSAS